MKEDFKILTESQISRLSHEEMVDYYRDLREFLYNSNEKIKGIEFRKKIHPLLRLLLKVKRILIGQSLEVLSDKSKKTDRPTIYAISHIGKYDLELVCEAIKDNFYIFCGDPETMYRKFDGYFIELNGVIYVDTESKSDRHIAKETAVRLLEQGGNLLIYPEGVWNLEPNKPMLPLYPGVIEIAYRTNATIVPVAIEQYDKEFIVNFGENFEVGPYFEDQEYSKEKEKIAKDDLRDVLATLKWDIWESTGKGNRDCFPDDFYDDFVNKKINEWPHYTKEIIDERVYKNKNETSYDEVFQFRKKLKPCKENAFLLREEKYK